MRVALIVLCPVTRLASCLACDELGDSIIMVCPFAYVTLYACVFFMVCILVLVNAEEKFPVQILAHFDEIPVDAPAI